MSQIETTKVRCDHYNEEWGREIWIVTCPECGGEARFMDGERASARRCRCGYVWRVEVKAVGEKPEKRKQ